MEIRMTPEHALPDGWESWLSTAPELATDSQSGPPVRFQRLAAVRHWPRLPPLCTSCRNGSNWPMAEGDLIRIIPHRGVDDDCGSVEVWFADGRKSVRFYWDNLVSRRLSGNTLTREQVVEKATALARAEMDKLDNPEWASRHSRTRLGAIRRRASIRQRYEAWSSADGSGDLSARFVLTRLKRSSRSKKFCPSKNVNLLFAA